MSNNQKEAKLLNATSAEFVGPLLKLLLLAKEGVSENSEMGAIIDKIIREVVKTKDSFDSIQNWERVLIGLFGKIERQIDLLIDHNEKRAEMNKSTVTTELIEIFYQLSQIPTEKAPDLLQKAKTTEVAESSTRSYQKKNLSEYSKSEILEYKRQNNLLQGLTIQAKLLKGNIAEFIGPLLIGLELAKERVSQNSEMVEIIDAIRTEVEKTKDSFDSILNWERVLIGLFGKIERKIDLSIDNSFDSTVTTELNDILRKLSQIPTTTPHGMHRFDTHPVFRPHHSMTSQMGHLNRP